MGETIAARLSGDARDHGLIFAGVVLAEAAGLVEGRHALQFQAYGPDARGRASRSDILLSDVEIESPLATRLDALVALTQEALLRYEGQLREGALLLCDASLGAASGRVSLPILRAKAVGVRAREGAEDPRLVGLTALGALLELRPWVSPAALHRALRDRLAQGELPACEAAMERGRALARERR